VSDWRTYVSWLTLAALGDWLLARTITRAAIFMPKSPPMLAVFQGMTLAGQLATTLAALLAIGGIAWLAWQSLSTQMHGMMRPRIAIPLPASLLGLLALSMVFLVVPPAGWPSTGYHALLLVALVSMAVLVRHEPRRERAVAWLVVAAGMVLGEVYQLVSALSVALHLAAPPVIAPWLYNAGEAMVVASAFVLWWAYGRGASWRVWLLSGLLALAFALGYRANSEMSGVLAIWSIGLTLYLPWPFYAVALCLNGVTVARSLQRDRLAACAILLLAAGGYAPQLSTQAFFGVIGLALLATPWMQIFSALPSSMPRPVTSRTPGLSGSLLK
jgi:hypothetical protein